MTPEELRAAVSRQIDAATGEGDDEISEARADLYDRYMGEPYGDEVDGRSAVISTDVSDTIEWILPELMEIFVGGDKVVAFTPVGPDDEVLADQETDIVNHVVMNENDGFLLIYTFIKDGLISKNGYVKRIWDERETTTVEEYENLTPDELAQVFADMQRDGGDVTLEESAATAEGVSVKFRVTKKSERLRIVPVPGEEMLIASRWNSVFLDDCPFVAHRRLATVSDLVAMGYDRKQVEGLPDAEDEEFGDAKVDRHDTRNASEYDQREAVDKSMREVLIHECYLRADYDDDGIAELRKVTVGGSGNEILRWADGGEDNEEVSSIPFSSWTPVILPHRHHGRSWAELVTDLQRIKTVLTRQMLDNIYSLNNGTKVIAQNLANKNTLRDAMVDRVGRVVRVDEPGGYQELQPPNVIAQSLQAIEHIESLRETRTGVTRYNQGLDASALNKTASGINQILTAAQKKIRLVARIFAETGMKHLLRGVHGDLRRYSTQEKTIRLRNSWVPVNPRHWRGREDVRVNVGIGTGNNDQMLARLAMIAEKQEQHLLNGSPMVSLRNLHHTYEQMVEKSGFQNPDAFFTPPDQFEQAPPRAAPPDPAAMQAQAAVQIEQMKAQARAQADAARLQFDQQSKAAEMAMQREKMAREDDRARDRLNIEAGLKLLEMNARNQTALTIEQVRQAAAGAAAANQPGDVR